MPLKRRDFLYFLGAGTGMVATGMYIPLPGWAADPTTQPTSTGSFQLPPLPYAYNALEPYIDERTMQFHHDKHHATYVKNLNGAIDKYPSLKGSSAEDLLRSRSLNSLPQDIRPIVRNNGGGHLNHSLFWKIIAPNAGGQPTGELLQDVQKTFGSFESFKQKFNEAGAKRFGSGWAWLVRTPQGRLEVTSTANQDSPLLEGKVPILGNDVWEHAYYLKYQNRREEYLNAWWNVVNWEEVDKRYRAALT